MCTVYPLQPNKHFKRNFAKSTRKEGTKRGKDKIINQILCAGTLASLLQHNFQQALYGERRRTSEIWGIRSNPRAQFRT